MNVYKIVFYVRDSPVGDALRKHTDFEWEMAKVEIPDDATRSQRTEIWQAAATSIVRHIQAKLDPPDFTSVV